MKFEITRTSLRFDDEQAPCKEARKEQCTRVDVRTVNDPRKVRAYKNQDPIWWYGEGQNHRVENGQIKRDFPDDYERWVIEVESLEQLLALQDEYGSLVLGWSFAGDGTRRIEIYDNYRE